LSSSASIEYAEDLFAGSLDINHKREINASGVIALVEGVSTGVTLKTDTSFSTVNTDIAVECKESDFTFGVCTGWKGADKKDVQGLRTTLFQSHGNNYTSGFIFDIAPETVLTNVHEFNLDDSTTLKSSWSTTGDVQAVMQHTMADPKVKLNLATSWKTSSGLLPLSATGYGLGITLGDF